MSKHTKFHFTQHFLIWLVTQPLELCFIHYLLDCVHLCCFHEDMKVYALHLHTSSCIHFTVLYVLRTAVASTSSDTPLPSTSTMGTSSMTLRPTSAASSSAALIARPVSLHQFITSAQKNRAFSLCVFVFIYLCIEQAMYINSTTTIIIIIISLLYIQQHIVTAFRFLTSSGFYSCSFTCFPTIHCCH